MVIAGWVAANLELRGVLTHLLQADHLLSVQIAEYKSTLGLPEVDDGHFVCAPMASRPRSSRARLIEGRVAVTCLTELHVSHQVCEERLETDVSM